jgi:hypothetical protein
MEQPVAVKTPNVMRHITDIGAWIAYIPPLMKKDRTA